MSQNTRQKNVFGQPLLPCSHDPETGFFRDGFCRTCKDDIGSHTVCAEMTSEFLEFSRSKGNDLSTPHPEAGFPGLRQGDCWCICALRWLEAYDNKIAPPVRLQATNEKVLEVITLDLLKSYALDIN